MWTGVELDNRGVKFVPGVCTVCHGASHAKGPFAGQPDIGGRFLPFDLDNFKYFDNTSFSQAMQERKFFRLNGLISFTNIAPVVQQLIDGWYPNGTETQISDFVPSGWVGHEELYNKVVKPSCRTCHVVMRDKINFNRFENLKDDDPGTPPDDRLGGFKARRVLPPNTPVLEEQAILIRARTCGYEMPNSKVTFNKFWGSPPETAPGPAILEQFLRDTLDDQTIACPPP